jgi:hypothetical protein
MKELIDYWLREGRLYREKKWSLHQDARPKTPSAKKWFNVGYYSVEPIDIMNPSRLPWTHTTFEAGDR